VIGALALGVVAGPVMGQDIALTDTERDVQAERGLGPSSSFLPEGATVPGAPEWGTQDFTWVAVPALACAESENQGYTSAFGWVYGSGSGTYRTFDCSVPLPSGTLIYAMGAEVEDSDASHNITMVLRRYDLYETTYTDLATKTSGGANGTMFLGSVFPDVTINNYAYGYAVRLLLNAPGSTLKFRTLYFAVKRQVSPAPMIATFSDVPVGSFGFQYIEALAASGITSGCGGGNFCPNEPLTRVQMAIFLAKALGLHWPG